MDIDTDKAVQLGEMIAHLESLDMLKKDIERQLKGVNQEIDELENKIMHRMIDEGIERASHGTLSVGPKKHTYAKVEDWEQLWAYIRENNAFQLLERRVSVTAYRDMLNLGRPVPGVVPNDIVKLSVTKVNRA